MARKTIYVSDMTGQEIENGSGAEVTIRFLDARKGQVVLDVNETDVENLIAVGRKEARRGRKPKVEA